MLEGGRTKVVEDFAGFREGDSVLAGGPKLEAHDRAQGGGESNNGRDLHGESRRRIRPNMVVLVAEFVRMVFDSSCSGS